MTMATMPQPQRRSPLSTPPDDDVDFEFNFLAAIPSASSSNAKQPSPAQTPPTLPKSIQRPLKPLTALGAHPKSQPLHRTMFAQNPRPSLGMPQNQKEKKNTNLIQTTKGFPRRFELKLSAEELARRC